MAFFQLLFNLLKVKITSYSPVMVRTESEFADRNHLKHFLEPRMSLYYRMQLFHSSYISNHSDKCYNFLSPKRPALENENICFETELLSGERVVKFAFLIASCVLKL